MTLHIRIRHCESGGFLAACPSLPGCSTRAETREEARKRLSEAIVGYLASVNNFVPDDVMNRIVEV
ncbi:MAG: type II toxin-antitoxin system HicB family antitoxin [Phycisphaerae bacterium]